MSANGTQPGRTVGAAPDADPVLPSAPKELTKARRHVPFKQADIARAIKAMHKAGLPVTAVKVEPGGTFIVIPGTPEAMPSSTPNPWDGGDA